MGGSAVSCILFIIGLFVVKGQETSPPILTVDVNDIFVNSNTTLACSTSSPPRSVVWFKTEQGSKQEEQVIVQQLVQDSLSCRSNNDAMECFCTSSHAYLCSIKSVNVTYDPHSWHGKAIYGNVQIKSDAFTFKLISACVYQYGEIEGQDMQLVFDFNWTTIEPRKVLCFKDQTYLGECVSLFASICSTTPSAFHVYSFYANAELTILYIYVHRINGNTSVEYTCAKENEQMSSRCIQLEVVDTNITIKTDADDVYANGSLTLTCSTSSPVTTVNWYTANRTSDTGELVLVQQFANGTCSQSSDFADCVCNSTTSYTCVLKMVELYHDGQLWWCSTTFDGVKRKSNNFTIDLIIPLTSVTLLPHYAESYLVFNQTTTFTCITSASRPRASIQWFVGDLNITHTANYTYSSQVVTSILRYTPTQFTTNKMTCNAVYKYKTTTVTKEQGTVLQVQYPVSKPIITMNDTSVSENASVHEFIPVEFKCSATGNPLPSYLWVYPGGNAVGHKVILVFNQTFSDENVSCDFKRTSVYQQISCMATNAYYSQNGTMSAFITTSVTYIKLNILIRPDVPTSLYALSVSETTMRLGWKSVVNGGDSQRFIIMFKNTESRNWTNVHIGIHTTSTLEGLEPGTSYQVKLFAENDVGKSKETDEIIIGTLVHKNTVIPECTSIVSQHSTSLTLLIGVAFGCALGGIMLSLVFERLIGKLWKKVKHRRNRVRTSGSYDTVQAPKERSTMSDAESKKCGQYEILSDTSPNRYSDIVLTTTVSTNQVKYIPPQERSTETETTSFSDVKAYSNLTFT